MMITKKLNKFSRGFVLILLAGFAFDSCKKEPLEFVIEGEIFDKSFGQLVDGGKVKLYKVLAATTQEVFISDQNIVDGKYKFVFDRDRSEKYVIRFEKEFYFEEVLTVFFSQLQVGETYTVNFNAEAIAMMNWVFTDVAPVNSNGSASIQKLNGRSTGAGACPNQEYEYFGGGVSDTLRCAVGGNQYIRFYVIDIPEFVLDSLYCSAFEDSFYQINF